MPNPLTTEQLLARDTRDVSVALEAGAGCGKTHVLTARYLSHLDPDNKHAEPADLDQLIAITFTDAAAREMRKRIRRACLDNLTAASTLDQQNFWLRLLRAIDSARVSTIHAFCTSLLRAHAIEANLDPMFRVLDQANADVLQYEAIEDVLRAQLDQLDPEALELAHNFGLSRIKQQLAELLAHRSDEHFQRWLAATPEEIVAAWRSQYHDVALPAAVREIARAAPIDKVLEQLAAAEPQKAIFQEARQRLFDLLPKLKAAAIDTGDILRIRELARVQGICTAKDWGGDKVASKAYTEACAQLRTTIDKLLPKTWDDEAALAAARLGLMLLRLADQVAAQYEHRKNLLGALDFDDQLARAHTLLTAPEHAPLRRRISERVRMVLVDEFQDTDQLQVDLVTMLSGPDSDRLFFVGDFKQSIYRFRGAEPHVFRALKSRVKKPGQLGLTINFRSQPGILSFVNYLFCHAIEGYAPLQPHRAQASSGAAVEFLWTIDGNKNSGIKGAAQESRRREATAIARRLRDLFENPSPEKLVVKRSSQECCAVQPGDVAILFRSLSDVRIYEEALREQGLDYYLVGGRAFYAQQEIFDVLNLLRAVASTADEVSLAGALRSPFFSLNDESLFWLVDKHGSLNAGLLAETLPAELSSDERQKVVAAGGTIRRLRAIKDTVSIAELLGEALARTGYDAVLLMEFLGERKLANLQKLVEQARAADQGGVIDLDSFIVQLAQFVASEPKEPLAATCPETANVIRLMTIHHAKGLEFPLVVIPDLDRSPNASTPAAALDKDLGPLVKLPDTSGHAEAVTGLELFNRREQIADREERLRLLYVACTRAADHLILSSSLQAHDALKSDWMELLEERFNLQTGAAATEPPAGYDPPHVQIAPEPAIDAKPIGKSRGPNLVHLVEDARQLAAERGGVVPADVAPIAVDRAARRQFSFSRLTGRIIRSDPAGRPTSADRTVDDTGPVDARGLGSLVHAVLERIGFAADADSIRRWCEQLAPEFVPLSADHAAVVAHELVEQFTRSPLAARLAAAAVVHRETEFLLTWPPNGYLQGNIDCLYQDGKGDWRLIDYKTNDVSADRAASEAKKYEMQLYVYAMAVERAVGRAPVELMIYFLRPGVEHVLPWNDAARERATKLVNNAIDELEW